MITIALDAMGGDLGLQATVPGVMRALARYDDIRLSLVGDSVQMKQYLSAHPQYAIYKERITLVHTTEVITMEDRPSSVLRSKKDSSMRKAIQLVKEGAADGCVSSGNTGALMALSYFILRTIPGVERPAIMKGLPTIAAETFMLDLGANVNSSATNLYEFAQMASTYVTEVLGITHPSIGLLNIGEEDGKGKETIKQCNQLLKDSGLNYYGFIEGNDIYKGTTNIVVCDGFEGNISLKSSEGLAKMISTILNDEFNKNWFTKLLALISLPVLKKINHRLNPDKYNGATLLGLNGVVVKSHGSASEYAFLQAIREARLEINAGMINKISTTMDV